MKILLINGGQRFAHSGGRLNDTLHEAARAQLAELGHALEETRIASGYAIEVEVRKILWADALIYQMPGWWMGAPWTVKKYLDEVFTAGHGSLYANDGRSRQDPDRHYGSGGLLQGRRYLLSLTWNAPQAAFDAPDEFFAGRGVDGVYFPFHKSQEFLGLQALPTFLATDVIKAPDVERDIRAYQAHLTEVFGAA
ncbi:NAD(P)H-dependent oxidoreductase [Azotobacter beijerinckii]|uniref:NAD(P)H-dependent oxidoreductase n=1 Tax=Azotobacter beijerinckii TaxID=170623 RepID=UPI0029532530|nr:NAD(P)H-dependent oxidoreductase [Azotobacter beijerinckii]MDV7213810.1 NAD(P)H-dependent oxidoreductase [Azotobacter beijerinckii]